MMSAEWHSVLVGAISIAASLCLSVLLILALRPLLHRYAIVQPNARSSHREPTPQGGGIAVIAATLIVSLVVAVSFGTNAAPQFAGFWPVALATLFIAAVGAAGDLHAITVVPRLVLHALAVAAVVAMLPAEARVVPALPLWIERVALVVAGLWFVNLVNFMDGVDWMTVAETVPVTLGLATLGALGDLPPLAAVVTLTLGGAMLGFAPFNRPVAKLFLGDVGSLPIGLLLGWLLMLLAAGGHLAAAVLLPLYYIADATATLLLRTARGRALWQAHRDHFYQRAVDRGVPVARVVSQVFAVNVALTMLALLTAWQASLAVDVVALVAGGGLVCALLIRLRGKSLA